MKLRHIALAIALAIPGVAWAHQCPSLMQKIDNILASEPDVPAEVLEEVEKLRMEGEAQHNAGLHDEAVSLLEEALELLGED